MLDLEKSLSSYDWFHSIGQDEYGRAVVYVNYLSSEISSAVPRFAEGKVVLVHFSAYKLATRESFVEDPQKSEEDTISSKLRALVGDFGKEVVNDIFFEIHDGKNALTNFSETYPYAKTRIQELYDEYGFDVLYDLLD